MRADDLCLGMSVQIVAADDFFQFVDGWIGTFTGYSSGYPVVKVVKDDGIKTFLVPADQLRPVNG